MDNTLEALKKRISSQRVVRDLISCNFGGEAYLVGGAIRDLFLDKTLNDYDLALTLQSDLKIIEKLFGASAFLLGKKPVQTYRIVKKDISIDITFINTCIEDDLLRRDFTMNAIAYSLKDNNMIDIFNGIDDIHRGTIRYPEKKSLVDDPLRMLKAIRHLSFMEGFSLDIKLIEAIKGLKHLICETAPERIKYEMDRVIASGNAHRGMKTMEETGILFEIFPELGLLRELDIEKGFVLETYGHTIDGFLYLKDFASKYKIDERMLINIGYALLFHDLGKAHTFSFDENKKMVHFFYHEKFSHKKASDIMERLRFSNHDIKTVLKLIDSHMRIFLISNSDSTEKATRRLVYTMEDLTPALIVLSLCDMYGSSGGQDNPSTEQVHKKCNDIIDTYEELKKEPLPKLINGNDLMAMGFPEGPKIGKILNEIREKQILGEITDTDSAVEYTKRFILQDNS